MENKPLASRERHMEWQRYEYKVSTDPKLLQMNVVHDFLRQMYWSYNFV